jgi:hypothetical protein
MESRKAASNTDGGYHAIRGFAFQFDATILEVFADPNSVIGIEGDQDIDIENYYIQVKLRSETFSRSKIARAVKQLIAQFSSNTDRKYRLYCHFEDRERGVTLKFDVEQLDEILGSDSDLYPDETRKLFADRFDVRFAPDFNTQFSAVLDQLKSRHRLRTFDEAIAFHAVINQFLTSLVLTKRPGSRTVTAADLDRAVRDTEQAIFQGAYQNHLGIERYIKLLRSQISGSKSVNILRRERLVIAEAGSERHIQDAIDFASAISARFYIRENSPQPYLAFRAIDDISGFKQQLWDAGIRFSDGTNFDGDRFRIEDLTGRLPKGKEIKLVHESKLAEVLEAMSFPEVYEFYSSQPVLETFEGSRLRRMAVDSMADAVKIMEIGGRS